MHFTESVSKLYMGWVTCFRLYDMITYSPMYASEFGVLRGTI